MAKRDPHLDPRRRHQAGVAAIEFVFVFPVLLLLFFGLVNFAHYISTSQKIAQAAVVAADVVSRANKAVKEADFTDAFTAAELAITPLAIGNVRVDVYDYYGSPGTLRWKKSSPNGPNCAPPDPSADTLRTLLIPSGATPSSDVVVSVVCMAYAAPVPRFPGLTQFFSNIVIQRSMYLRPRLSSTLTCDAC